MRLVFYEGEPKVGDLNFISRVFGKGANGRPIQASRALLFSSRAHFFAASRAWFSKRRKER